MSTMKVYDTTGKEQSTVAVNLAETMNGATAYAVSIRRLLQQWRQGTVGSKTRGEVAMSNKKPWRQKGTGRARAGTSRSPLWRKGGCIFGPQARTRTIDIPRAQRRLAMRAIGSMMLKENRIHCIDAEVAGDKPSTKTARALLKSMNLADSKVVVFLPLNDTKTYLSFRNMPNVHVVFFDQPNAFDLTSGQNWVVLKRDVEQFNEMVARWK